MTMPDDESPDTKHLSDAPASNDLPLFPEPTIDSDEPTAQAPPFVEPATPRASAQPHLIGLPPAGAILGDFELLRILGVGSFARVYLARQLSLGRPVALKVSYNHGQEAQALAQLEHDHIVSVYSESLEGELHVLCMQYVAGTTLETIIACLEGTRRDGTALLAVLDERVREATALDLAALRDRELISSLDDIETVCWLGARLAEALAHAHGQGIEHRDIKPANVLVNRYGRPLLADFNVAQFSAETGGGFGGTLAYMSPEHLEAFQGKRADVDARADLYSLGVVLYQFYTGDFPFPLPGEGGMQQVIDALLLARRAGPPPLSARRPAPPALERVMSQCLAADPDERQSTAAELAHDLESCLEMRRVQRRMPESRHLTRWAMASPLLYVALLVPLPHLLGSIVNVTYNQTRIISRLSDDQQAWFPGIVLVYNLVAYPLLLYIFFRQAMPVFHAWNALPKPGAIDAETVDAARQRAMTLPGWLTGLSCLGWLPGGLFFPLALHLLAGPLPPVFFGQFLVSFTISGLIAVTYSALLMELLVVRVLYPGLFLDARDLRERARAELKSEESRLGALQFQAVLVPLAGAALILGVGPGEFSPAAYQGFRILVTALLGAGMLGLGLAVFVAGEVRDSLAALTGTVR